MTLTGYLSTSVESHYEHETEFILIALLIIKIKFHGNKINKADLI